MTAEVIHLGGIDIRYLQEAGSGCEASCFEMRVPPGARVPPAHSHTANEELVYVLEGVLRYSVDGVTRDLGAGDTMGTPAGSVHAFSNPCDVPVRALVFNTPGIGANYFRDIAAIVARPGPPDFAALVGTMKQYGLQPAPAG